MADPSGSAVYSKGLDTTFFYDDSGKLTGSTKGYSSGNAAASPTEMEPRGPRLNATNKVMQVMKQTGKDSAVDMFSQIPLMIPGEGIGMKIARQVGSLGAGFGLDRLLNPDKPGVNSMEDAALNTGISDITNHLMENPPSIAAFNKGPSYGMKGIAGGVLNLMKGTPAIPEVQEALPVIRGVGGKFVSNKANYAAYMEYLNKKAALSKLSNGLGLGVNAGLDLGNNLSNK